jgi:hypothetical protein
MHDFKMFTRKLGYSLICKDQTKFHILLETVLKGITQARYLKDVCDFKNVVAVAKKVGELNDDIKTYTEKRNQLNAKHAELTKNLQPGKSVTVSPDSYVDGFRQQLTLSRTEITKIRSRIEQAQQQLVTLKGLGDKSTDYAKALVTGVTGQIKIAEREQGGILLRLSELGKSIRKLVGEKASVQSKFEAKTAGAREKQLRKVTEAYKGKRNAQERIDEDMKEWDRIQKRILAAKLKNVDAKHAERVAGDNAGSASSVLRAQEKEVTDLQAQLVTVKANIAVLTENLKKARIGAVLDPLAREARINDIQQQLNVDRAALKAAEKRTSRREAALENETDENVWDARVTKFLSQDRAASQAVATMPNTFLYNTLLSGASERAETLSRQAWRQFKKSKGKREFKFTHNEFANVHFGATGFVPVPQFRKFTAEINQIIVYGLGAAFKDQDVDDAKPFLVAAVMGLVKPGLETETEQRKLFEGEVKRLKAWLASPKSHPITEEIVEMLMESGKMPLPPGKTRVTPQAVKATAQNLLRLIVEADAIGKLVGMAYQAYRNYMAMWMRNAMKLKRTGPGGFSNGTSPKLDMSYGGKKPRVKLRQGKPYRPDLDQNPDLPPVTKTKKPTLKPAPVGKVTKVAPPKPTAPLKHAKVAPPKPVKLAAPKPAVKLSKPTAPVSRTSKFK